MSNTLYFTKISLSTTNSDNRIIFKIGMNRKILFHVLLVELALDDRLKVSGNNIQQSKSNSEIEITGI